MTETKEIELKVAQLFLKKMLLTEVKVEEIEFGNHLIKEPDILYHKKGIELGAIVSQINTKIDKFENTFLTKLNQLIIGKILPNFSVKLNFQDDKESVKHIATKDFKKYKYLAKHLDGFFLYLNEQEPNPQVTINQKGLMRTAIFPNPNNQEINIFANELIEFIINIDPKSYKNQCFDSSDYRGGSVCVHFSVCSGTITKNPNPLDKFFSKSIINKFENDKYEGKFEEKILLLHNYNPISKVLFASDIHFYQHYRENIFNKISDLIKINNSFEIYNNIYFADFSLYYPANNFELINFSKYTKKQLNNNPSQEGHIRVSLS